MRGFRRFIIKTAEVMMIFVVILITIGSAVSGAGYAEIVFGSGYFVVGAIIGAFFGFVSAAIIAAYFFLLAEIAENTRTART